MDLERSEFEKWAAEVEGLRNFTREGDNYANAEVRRAWRCWQAGYAKGVEDAY